MTNTSSYSKGDLLEAKSYELLKTLLENDDFYVSGKKSKIFRKKGYYSEKRKSEIIFDISIETYLNNTSNYSLLTLINFSKPMSPPPTITRRNFSSFKNIGKRLFDSFKTVECLLIHKFSRLNSLRQIFFIKMLKM